MHVQANGVQMCNSTITHWLYRYVLDVKRPYSSAHTCSAFGSISLCLGTSKNGVEKPSSTLELEKLITSAPISSQTTTKWKKKRKMECAYLNVEQSTCRIKNCSQKHFADYFNVLHLFWQMRGDTLKLLPGSCGNVGRDRVENGDDCARERNAFHLRCKCCIVLVYRVPCVCG